MATVKKIAPSSTTAIVKTDIENELLTRRNVASVTGTNTPASSSEMVGEAIKQRTSTRRHPVNHSDRRHSIQAPLPSCQTMNRTTNISVTPSTCSSNYGLPPSLRTSNNSVVDHTKTNGGSMPNPWPAGWPTPLINMSNTSGNNHNNGNIDTELLNALSSIAPAPRRLEYSTPKIRSTSSPSAGIANPTGTYTHSTSEIITGEEETPGEGKVKFVNATVEILKNQIKREEAPKKKRTRTTPEQLRILQRAFSADPMPSSSNRLLLAKRLGMNARAVQVWFQNRRAKEKLEARRAEPPLSMTPVPTNINHHHNTTTGSIPSRSASVDSGRIRAPRTTPISHSMPFGGGGGGGNSGNFARLHQPPYYNGKGLGLSMACSSNSSAVQLSLATQQLDALDEGLEMFMVNGLNGHTAMNGMYRSGFSFEAISGPGPVFTGTTALEGEVLGKEGRISPNSVNSSQYFKFHSLPAAVCFGRPTLSSSLTSTASAPLSTSSSGLGNGHHLHQQHYQHQTNGMMLFGLPPSPNKQSSATIPDDSMNHCTSEEVLNAINELPDFEDANEAITLDQRSIFSSPRAGEAFLGGHSTSSSSPILDNCIPIPKSRSFSVPNLSHHTNDGSITFDANNTLNDNLGDGQEEIPLLFQTSDLLMLREEELVGQLSSLPQEERVSSELNLPRLTTSSLPETIPPPSSAPSSLSIPLPRPLPSLGAKQISIDDVLPSASLAMPFDEMADILGISDWTKEVV